MGKSSLGPVLDGLYCRISWAVAAPATVLALTAALFAAMSGSGVVLPFFLILLSLLHVWLIPILALRLLPEPLRIRCIDWLALPPAMGLKCLGPLPYIFQSLLYRFSKKTPIFQGGTLAFHGGQTVTAVSRIPENRLRGEYGPGIRQVLIFQGARDSFSGRAQGACLPIRKLLIQGSRIITSYALANGTNK